MNTKKLLLTIGVGAALFSTAMSSHADSCVYVQSSPGGSFDVCEEPRSQADCDSVSGAYSAGACDLTGLVGSCVTPSSTIHYFSGAASTLQTGCGFQGGTWQDAPVGGGDGGSTDGGSTDGGSTDGGSTDGGSTDGGSTDGGSTDGGAPPTQTIYGPTRRAERALDSDSTCTFTDHGNYYSWVRTNPDRRDNRGVIFYSGGPVLAEAYAKIARNACVLRQDAFLLKGTGIEQITTNPNAAIEPIIDNPGIQTWAVGGHSLGGVIGSLFIQNNPGLVDGLILLGSEPAGPVIGAKAMTVYGTLDPFETPEEVQASLALLPADTWVIEIEGGNHSQFGDYGLQEGDNESPLSVGQQQSEFKYEIRNFMDYLAEIEGTTDGVSTDGGSTDGGSTDGGSTDGGSTDGGSTDGGSTDGGSTDGGSTDGGSTPVEGSCIYAQSSPGGTFDVCEEPKTDADCASVNGTFSTGACDLSAVVGSCVTPTSTFNYLTGDPGSLEIGCGFQGGTWVLP